MGMLSPVDVQVAQKATYDSQALESTRQATKKEQGNSEAFPMTRALATTAMAKNELDYLNGLEVDNPDKLWGMIFSFAGKQQRATERVLKGFSMLRSLQVRIVRDTIRMRIIKSVEPQNTPETNLMKMCTREWQETFSRYKAHEYFTVGKGVFHGWSQEQEEFINLTKAHPAIQEADDSVDILPAQIEADHLLFALNSCEAPLSGRLLAVHHFGQNGEDYQQLKLRLHEEADLLEMQAGIQAYNEASSLTSIMQTMELLES